MNLSFLPDPCWVTVIGGTCMVKLIDCASVEFINQVENVAEGEDHPPDLHLPGYKKLRIELSTHAIGGLSENDFIVAAKINELAV